ncbi:hypothetical protein PE067_08470 [Paracoccus sp. DMF-8]|uniref:hypothetical protein n=1 Tax=Paracoccus sp. DMF-8 TaxID=3019445 RepID=UPI0023E7EE28|nr:hypothetical protein [Paracoccus sp. DMF-8]MDF3606159.1 hypothetical protein [Paracoccus sp. DMF-8]
MIRAIWAYLRQPDAYPDDWYRWMGGQAGHAAIIGGPLALIGVAAGIWVGIVGTLVGLAYWLGWEVLIQRGADWRDSLDDATHVTLGASITSLPFAFVPPADHKAAAAAMGAVWLIWLAVLASGIRKRLKGDDDGPI